MPCVEAPSDEHEPEAFVPPEPAADRAPAWPPAKPCADEVADDRREAVDAYLRRHPEIDGGLRVGWRDGRRTLYVALVGEAAAHEDRLRELAGERIAFEHVPRTVTELEAVTDRLVADVPELGAAGFELLGLVPDHRRGAVEAEVVGGPDAAAAEQYFAGRYGDAVRVRWLG